jgi:hypothetical protein
MRQEGGIVLVRPHAGLCNRLRVLVSALIFAHAAQRRLLLHWMPGDGCWCRYEDLFEPHPEIFRAKNSAPVLPPRIGKELEWLARQMPKKLHAAQLAFRHHIPAPFQVLTRIEIEDAGFILDPDAFRNYPSIIIFRNVMSFRPTTLTREEYHAAVSAVLKSLMPVAPVRDKLFDLPPGTIGVHARRGDHVRSQTISTHEAFLHAIQARLEHAPQANLFVASDDPAFIAKLASAYPGRTITRGPMELDRHKEAGQQDALADLLMLARCSEIIGSALSSFSDYAAAFERVPLHQAGLPQRRAY